MRSQYYCEEAEQTYPDKLAAIKYFNTCRKESPLKSSFRRVIIKTVKNKLDLVHIKCIVVVIIRTRTSISGTVCLIVDHEYAQLSPCRSHHYINVPVQFKPQAEGVFEGLLAVHTTKYGCINIRLCGKAIAKE